ncbi:cation channel [Desmophyllum pertusum]|uniref:Cation channel n=1 Tax=Desmophyllum pertusum TaxID=174260 RepID=A0A9W9ZAA3_9CNID|nr:cation channel [Desmophyllum pertusum]
MAANGKTAELFDQLLKGFKFVAQNIKSLLSLGLAGIAVGLNLRINSEFFDCPGKNYKPYGYMFLFAPCVILLLVGMIIVRLDPKRLTNAVAQQKPGTSKLGTFRNVINPALSRPLAAPFAWLIVSMAQADYFVCATVGPGPPRKEEI